MVVEHTGWPRSGSDEEYALWRTGIDALAGLGDNIVCKLSGLAMPFASIGVEAFAPWLEYAIEAFGVDRCMFASNFPVDSMFGTFDQLYSVFTTVTAGLDAASAGQALCRQRRAGVPLLEASAGAEDLVDLAELVGGEGQVLDGGDVLLELGQAADPDQGGGDPLVS